MGIQRNMWGCSFNNFTFIGGSIMVEINEDEFERMVLDSNQKLKDLNFKKLVLKSLRINIENKDSNEIENLYQVYVMSLYNDC